MNAMSATHRKISTLIADPEPTLNALNKLSYPRIDTEPVLFAPPVRM